MIQLTKHQNFLINGRQINTLRFSVRFVTIMRNNFGFKTIGQARKFLSHCKPTCKLYYGMTYCRAIKLRHELDLYLSFYK
jgi:hypothetical protein